METKIVKVYLRERPFVRKEFESPNKKMTIKLIDYVKSTDQVEKKKCTKISISDEQKYFF